MNLLTDLVKQIAAYLILLSAIKHLLDRSVFGKYINFFTGLLLILIIVSPVLRLFSMEENLNTNLSLDFLETNRKELEKELAVADEITAGQLEGAYGDAIQEQAGYLLQDYGVEIISCTPIFREGQGGLAGLQLVLKEKEEAIAPSAIKIDKIEEIDKIEIQGTASEGASVGMEEKAGERTKRWLRKEQDILQELSVYYQIEKEAIKLQWKA